MDVSQTTRAVPPGGHYSPSLRAGDFLFVAGQTPRDGERRIIGTTIEGQTFATLENIRMILERDGATIQHIVKVTVYLADMNDAPRFNAEYARYFGDHKPPRATVGVQLNGVLIEIEVMAYLGK